MLAGDLQMAAGLADQAAAKDSGNPKIVANQEMIAGLLKSRRETAPAPGPQSALPKTMQPVAVQHLPTPTTASAAPKPLHQTASGAPRVIMQKVPFDPYAGPVKQASAPKEASHPPRKLAKDAPPALKKRVAEAPAPKDPIPALRTASD